MLAHSLRRLAKRTGCERAVAWQQNPAGPIVAAALSPVGAAIPVDPLAFEASAQIEGAFDLGRLRGGAAPDAAGRAALGLLAQDHGLCAGVCSRDAQGRAVALLLIGSSDADPPGRVRTATLTALDEEADRVRAQRASLFADEPEATLRPELQRLDQLASLGELTGELIHEIRNPLVSVSTFLQLLPEHLEDAEFTDGYRQIVIDEIKRIERLLEAFGRQAHATRPRSADAEAARFASLDAIAEEVATLLGMRARERGLELRIEFPSSLPLVEIDPDELRQIVLNLVQNAFEATPKGGTVALRVELPTPDSRSLALLVDDSGRGIPEEQRENLFAPFQTTRSGEPGGLGLAITRRFVERAGGTIEVQQSPEGGARFQIRLPAASRETSDRLLGADLAR